VDRKGSKHHQRNFGHQLFQVRRCLNAVHARHGKIENDQIRLEFFRLLDSFVTILSFAAYLQVALRFQQALQTLSKRGAVVDDKNPLRHAMWGCSHSHNLRPTARFRNKVSAVRYCTQSCGASANCLSNRA
jgi:hypothetical protein